MTGTEESNPTARLPGQSSRSGERDCPFGRDPETHRVSPARAERCPQDPCHPHQQRPAPGPAGRALAGGFGPPAGQGSAWRCGRGDGPCHGNDAVPPPLRAGPRNAPRFPARAERCHQDRCNPHRQRPAPAGGGAGAGRGLWAPRRAKGQRSAVAGAMAPANEAVKVLSSGRAGTGNALRFPRPCGTLPRRPSPPAPTEASTRPGGREAPAEGGAGAGRGLWAPGWPGINVAPWQG